jgi:oligopeptide transport system substrate-binding protein
VRHIAVRGLLASLLAALCSSSAVHPGFAQPAAQEVRVNFLTQGEPNTLDPTRSGVAAEAAVIRQVFEPLLRFDGSLTPQPAAAESYEVSPDETVYTFHLRSDGRWSDGQPVTAAHFEYAWKRILDPRLSAEFAPFFAQAGVADVRATNDSTFEIQLSKPFGALPGLAALWVVSPLRPDIVGADPDGWAQAAATYIGNGPFMMSEWDHQDHITLVPNPRYTAHAGWTTPVLSKVTISMGSSAEREFAAYLNDERDWTLVPDARVSQVLNDAQLAAQARQFTELTTYWIHMNNARAPLSNVNVRRALAKAIDRAALLRDLAGGVGIPTTSIIPPGMAGFQEGLGQELGFDPQGARALLARAGFPNGENWPRLEFSFSGNSASLRRAGFFQAQWKQNLGIDIALNAMESRAYQRAFFTDKDYDLAFGGWEADYPDPQDWFSTLFGCRGGYNQYNYCNPTFDQVVARADSGSDLSDRLLQYGQAQTILIQDVPVAPLFVRGRLVLVKPWVQSVGGEPLMITASDDYPGSFFLDWVQILPH